MKRDTKDNKRLAFKQLLDSVDGAATATAILVGVSGALRCEMKEVALIMMIVWWNSKLRGQSRSIMIPSTVTDSPSSPAQPTFYNLHAVKQTVEVVTHITHGLSFKHPRA